MDMEDLTEVAIEEGVYDPSLSEQGLRQALMRNMMTPKQLREEEEKRKKKERANSKVPPHPPMRPRESPARTHTRFWGTHVPFLVHINTPPHRQ